MKFPLSIQGDTELVDSTGSFVCSTLPRDSDVGTKDDYDRASVILSLCNGYVTEGRGGGTRVVICVQGGNVKGVVSDSRDVEYVILDYDTMGCEPEQLHKAMEFPGVLEREHASDCTMVHDYADHEPSYTGIAFAIQKLGPNPQPVSAIELVISAYEDALTSAIYDEQNGDEVPPEIHEGIAAARRELALFRTLMAQRGAPA